MLFAKGTALDRKILRKGIDKTAVDRAVACHNTLSGQILLLLSKVGAAMTHKEVKLDKGVLVKEQCNALARCQLSFAVLLFDTLWSAPKHELLFFLEHQVNFFLDCGHHIPPDVFIVKIPAEKHRSHRYFSVGLWDASWLQQMLR